MPQTPSDHSWLQLSPENRILLATADVEMRDDDLNEIDSLISAGIDWELLVESAGQQRLTGLLHHHLSGNDLISEVPQFAMNELNSAHLFLVAKGAYFDKEIKSLLRALSDENIPAILLKGAALREVIFQDQSVRPMSDIDILVNESQVRVTQAIAVGLGYEPVASLEAQKKAEQVGRHLPRLQGIGKPTAIEVHRHILSLDSPLTFDISGFWERSIEIEVQGEQTRMLSFEDQLIHLSMGFMLDRQFKSASALGQLADIHAVIEHPDTSVNWDQLLDTLSDYGLMALVGCAITLSRLLVGTNVPSDVASSLWPVGTTDDELAMFVDTRVLASGGFVATGLVTPASSYRARSLVRSICRRLLPERIYLISKYGDSARGFWGLRYYLVRLLEALSVVGRGLRHPRNLHNDFAVDRWMHSLFDKS